MQLVICNLLEAFKVYAKAPFRRRAARPKEGLAAAPGALGLRNLFDYSELYLVSTIGQGKRIHVNGWGSNDFVGACQYWEVETFRPLKGRSRPWDASMSP